MLLSKLRTNQFVSNVLGGGDVMSHLNLLVSHQRKSIIRRLKGRRGSIAERRHTLIVDDDPVIRSVLASILVRERLVVKEAKSLREAGRQLIRDAFDLIFLDLYFRNEIRSGFDFLDSVRSIQPSCKIIIITSSTRVDDAITALRNRVYDYLNKPFRAQDVHRVIRRSIEAPVLNDWSMDAPHPDRFSVATNVNLTERECEILDLLARGYRYIEAAEFLDCGLTTIQTHVKHIYRKLRVHSRAEAVYEAQQLKLIKG